MNKYTALMERLTDFQGNMPIQTPHEISEAELDSVEVDLGQTLPDDYREFLRCYGNSIVGSGIEFDATQHNTPKYGGCEFFYGVDPSKQFTNLVTKYKNQGDNWPKELLPISESDNGLMCIVIAGSEKGAIYFRHMGQGAAVSIPESLYFVARSFDDFMRKLV